MTPEQMTELAARLRDVAKWNRVLSRNPQRAADCDAAADLIESMAQRVLDEPVAFRDPETGDFSRVRRVGWQPLYLYPQSTSDAQRVPLPGNKIVTMYAECPRSDAEMIKFARAIEQAHGIRSEE